MPKSKAELVGIAVDKLFVVLSFAGFIGIGCLAAYVVFICFHGLAQ